jgi:hypothetical protein
MIGSFSRMVQEAWLPFQEVVEDFADVDINISSQTKTNPSLARGVLGEGLGRDALRS